MEPYTPVHEKILVTVDFLPTGKHQIREFTWRKRNYLVTETILISQAFHGRETVWIFHVATATAAFKLRLDTASLTWWLEEYTWEETN